MHTLFGFSGESGITPKATTRRSDVPRGTSGLARIISCYSTVYG